MKDFINALGNQLEEMARADEKARKRRLIPDGTYKVVCAHLEQRASTVTGRPYLMATQVVIGGPHAGTLIHQPLAFTEAARWIWEDVVESPFNLGGQRFMLAATQEQYQNEWRMRGGKMLPLTPESPPRVSLKEEGKPIKVRLFGRAGRGVVWFVR